VQTDVRIDTERLELRQLTLDDLDELVSLHADPDVSQFIGHVDRSQTIQALEANAAQWAERGHGNFAVIHRHSSRFLGRVALKYWPQFDETEVGWALRREEWGNGFATEAARAGADWGFDNLPVPYLTAYIRPENTRSIQVAERLGMSRLREDVLNKIPVVVYAVGRTGRRERG
jgi:RimJ/RimL family protein N-acetyltransferase